MPLALGMRFGNPNLIKKNMQGKGFSCLAAKFGGAAKVFSLAAPSPFFFKRKARRFEPSNP